MVDRREKERRKVQINGKSSFMVALPKKWVRELKLRQGSEVTITKLNPTSLLVQAQAKMAQSAGGGALLEMSPDDSLEAILRRIVSLYVLGFSRITVETRGGLFASARKLALKDTVRRTLIGTESIAESNSSLTIHILLGYSDLSVEGAIKKMLLLVDSLMKDAILVLETDDPVPAESIADRQDEVGRFERYVIRQLNLSLNQGAPPELRFENREMLGYILIARDLDRITHHARNLLDTINGLKGVLPRTVVEVLVSSNKNASDFVDEALLSLFKRDYQGAGLVIEKTKEFVNREAELIHSLEGSDSQTYYMLHLLMDSQRSIAEYARDVAEVVLDMTVERTTSKPELTANPVPYV